MDTNVEFRVAEGDEVVLYALLHYVEYSLKNKRKYLDKKEELPCCSYDEALETIDTISQSLSNKDFCVAEEQNREVKTNNSMLRKAVYQSKKTMSHFENQKLIEVINALTEKQRTAFCLYYLEGYRFEEIALIMGISSRTVKDHLDRALEEIIFNEKKILRGD